MNYLDIIIIVPLLWGAYKGFKNGLIVEVASLAALALGVWGSVRFSAVTEGWLDSNTQVDEHYLPVLAFAITFIIIVIGIHFLARLINKLVDAVALGIINRIAGIAFGMAKFLIIVSFLLVVLNRLNANFNFLDEALLQDSKLFYPLVEFAEAMYDKFMPEDGNIPKVEI